MIINEWIAKTSLRDNLNVIKNNTVFMHPTNAAENHGTYI